MVLSLVVSFMFFVFEPITMYANNIDDFWFDFYTPSGKVADIQLGVPVWVNIENGVAAMAVAWLMGATEEELR